MKKQEKKQTGPAIPEAVADLATWYEQGKYLELNFEAFVDYFGGRVLALDWLYEMGWNFNIKPFFIGKGKSRARAKGFDTIAMCKHYRFQPKNKK